MAGSRDLVRDHLRKWETDLIGLTKRDRLLYFKHLKSGSLEFEQDAPTVLGRLRGRRASAGWGFYLPPDPDDGSNLQVPSSERHAVFEVPGPRAVRPPRDDELVIAASQNKTSKQIRRSLKSLSSKSRAEFLDAGIWVLHLGLGLLRWREGEDEAASPLYLLPVNLELRREREQWRMMLSEEGEPALNPSLAVKLEQDLGVSLPTLDDLEDNSYDAAVDDVRRAVEGTGWRIDETAVLSTFTFHKEVIYRDLRANEEAVAGNPMVRLLAEGPNSAGCEALSFEPEPDRGLDDRHPPEELACILDADATQRQCIIAARQGHSFVMDGPPGTGKSQTIANVIAQLIGDGKTVLFVSEKAAALDVVYSRLAEVSLDRFVLALHSHKATRKAVAQDLGEALATIPRATSRFAARDHADIKHERKQLTDYALAVNEVRLPSQRSLHDVIGEISEISGLGDYPVTPLPDVDSATLDIEDLARIEHLSARLGRAWAPIERGDQFLWRDLVEHRASRSSETDCRHRVVRLRNALSRLETASEAVHEDLWIAGKPSPATAEWLQGLLRLVENRPPVAGAWLAAPDLDDATARVRRLAAEAGELAAAETRLAAEVSDWQQLDPAAAERLEHHSASCAEIDPPFSGDVSGGASDLMALKQTLDDAGEHVEQARRSAGLLAGAFRAGPVEDIPLVAIDRLVELGRLAASDNPPEPGWFSRKGLRAASDALRLLSEIVPRYLSLRDRLVADFEPAVIELDLEALRERRDARLKIFGRLGRGHRADKATVAAATVSGKATGRTMRRLEELIAWQQARRELEATESAHAAVLGAYYADCDRAEFERAASAVEIATRAVQAAARWADDRGGTIGARSLAAVVGRDATICGVLDAADHTATHLEAFRHGPLASRTGPAMLAHEFRTLAHIGNWCSALATACSAMAGELSTINELSGMSVTVAQAQALLRRRSEQAQRAAAVQALARSVRHLIGEMAEQPDRVELHDACEWASRIRTHLGGEIEPRTAELILRSDRREADTAEPAARAKKALDDLLDVFAEGPHREALIEELQHSYGSAYELLDALEDSVADLRTWSDYVDSRQALVSEGLTPAVEECERRGTPAGDVAPTLKLALLNRWADQIVDRDDRLEPRRAQDRDSIRESFRRLDRELVQNTAASVINACASRRPKSSAGGAGVIRKEALLKRRHKPVRALLGLAGDAAQRLKPCFMMSPLSVSQFLPADFTFDAVIFDEASQVKEADAIGCIYRGSQLIVAGDDKQLPPTSFFDRMADTDEDELDQASEEVLAFESVLDRCKAQGLTSLPLRWHYRSRHEDLITYSNYRFYDGKLHTFPGAVSDAPDLGVELFRVDGVYRRGATRDNIQEAVKVVDRVLHHRRHHPRATIGVVALSTAQQFAVEAEIERRAANEPELRELETGDRLSGFFTKNLESVQGDERDIVIVTIGYGPDENGKLTMNFGPINREGGERRLNVAVTRARRRIEIVSSISGGDIRVAGGETHSDVGGLAHLRGYLDFAERGRHALAVDLRDSRSDSESPFEEDVLRASRAMGFEAVPQVGAAGYRIDIGIRHPDKPGSYLLGVECDGASYHSSKVARDRDRLRQEILEGLGWTIHRIWSTAWFADRDREIRALRSAIDSALQAPPGSGGPRPTPPGPAVDTVPTVPSDLDTRPEWAHDYVEPTASAPPSATAEFDDPAFRSVIVAQICEVVDNHSPIHRAVVLKTVRTAWRRGRAGGRMRKAFDNAVGRAVADDSIEQRGDWLRSPHGSTEVRVPASDDAPRRPVEHVPPDEIELAVVHLLEDAGTSRNADLRGAWARLYGWKRVGPDIERAFDRAVRALITAGKVNGPDPLSLAD
jgi:very-short-patch-repair endonuclease